jgi:hypothetical protein
MNKYHDLITALVYLAVALLLLYSCSAFALVQGGTP